MIFITGATGKTGYEVAKSLAELSIPFKALIRNETKESQITELGGQAIIGSIEDKELLNQALEGTNKALLLLPNSEQQLSLEKQFVDAAVKAEVKHVVKCLLWKLSQKPPEPSQGCMLNLKTTSKTLVYHGL